MTKMKPPFIRRANILTNPRNAGTLTSALSEPKKFKFLYIDPKAVERYLGRFAPLNAFLFSKLLEEVLTGLNEGYVQWTGRQGRLKSDPIQVSERLLGISDKLLQNNLNRAGLAPYDFFDALDFDVVHSATKNQGVVTRVNAYFFHAEFARPSTDWRVVLHIVHNNFDGTEWSISVPLQMLMRGFPSIPDNHIGYAHSIALKD